MNTIFAGTTLGLFRSTDEGKTWTKVTSDPLKSVAFDGSRMLLASLRGGVLISPNGGETVHAVNQGFSNRSLAARQRRLRAPRVRGWIAAGGNQPGLVFAKPASRPGCP